MAAESGKLELNAFKLVLFYNLFESIETLKNAATTLIDNCIKGITANKETCKELVENSVGIVTALCPYIGYKNSSIIAKKSLNTGASIRQIFCQEYSLKKY